MIIRSFLICISLCAIFLIEARADVRGCVAVSAGNGPGLRLDNGREGNVYLLVGDSLYRQGNYFEASIYYERVLFESTDRSDQYAAVLGKTQCLKKQGLYDQTVTFLEGWQSYAFPDSCLVSIHYQQVLCTYLGGHFENTISLVDRWPYVHGGRAPEPLVAILKILSLNELQRWPEAATAYREFISQRVTDRTLPDLYTNLPHMKSVSKAQILSYIIPGGGQFYAGKIGEGLVSLVIQGAGIWFAVLSFEQHYYVSAWLVGAALFGAFRAGSVKRSEILVRQYNRKQMLHFNEKVRAQLLQTLP